MLRLLSFIPTIRGNVIHCRRAERSMQSSSMTGTSNIDTSNDSDDGLVVKRRVLAAPELTVLQQRLGSETLHQFTGIINADHQPRPSDCQTILEVSIPRGRTLQRFVMRGFDAKGGRPFPRAINALLCGVDGLTHVQYRLSSNSPE
jgi:hypothetical protein